MEGPIVGAGDSQPVQCRKPLDGEIVQDQKGSNSELVRHQKAFDDGLTMGWVLMMVWFSHRLLKNSCRANQNSHGEPDPKPTYHLYLTFG